KKDQKGLFQRFYRASNAINSEQKGSGLGLLLIKQYVSQHKGQIDVISPENKGSEFFIRFQRGKGHFEPALIVEDIVLPDIHVEDEDDAEHEVVKTKILIVEDNDELRKYVAHTLSKHYQV